MGSMLPYIAAPWIRHGYWLVVWNSLWPKTLPAVVRLCKLVGGLEHALYSGWWFGTRFFPYIENFMIPIDEVHHFSEG